MSRILNPAPSIRKGAVYKIDPLKIYVKCKQCGNEFIHDYNVNFDIVCPNCRNHSDPDRIQRGYRPMIVIQEPSYIDSSNTVTVIPITSSSRRIDNLPGITFINRSPSLKLGEDLFYFALIYQIRTVNRNSVFKEKYCGHISESDLNQIDKKLKSFFAL